jgi:hypothetical protein
MAGVTLIAAKAVIGVLMALEGCHVRRINGVPLRRRDDFTRQSFGAGSYKRGFVIVGAVLRCVER